MTRVSLFFMFICLSLSCDSVRQSNSNQRADKNGPIPGFSVGATVTRELCGQVKTTPNLHNVECDNPGCACLADGKWCWKGTTLTVQPNTLPGEGTWRFNGTPPRVVCVRDNQDSCNWNELGKADRFR